MRLRQMAHSQRELRLKLRRNFQQKLTLPIFLTAYKWCDKIIVT